MKLLTRFAADFARVFYAPGRLYRDIRAGRPTPSWICFLLYCAIYTGMAAWLAARGQRPFTPPWLKLDEDLYYLVETFYAAPLVFLVWVLAAGLARTLGRAFRGSGSFERIYRMMGYSLWAPWYPLIVADFLGGVIPGPVYDLVLGACLALLLFQNAVAVKVEEGIGWIQAAVTSVLCIAATGVILFTYIR